MSLKERIEEEVQKLKDFQGGIDDVRHSTTTILINISEFIDNDLDDLVNELEEIADEVGKKEDQVEELEEELEDLQGGE